MIREYKQRAVFYIPSELIEPLKTIAFKKGLIRGGEGAISLYISTLIMDDLENRYPILPINYSDSDIKKYNVTLPDKVRKQMDNRAKELGFYRGSRGNLNKYVINLIYYTLQQ